MAANKKTQKAKEKQAKTKEVDEFLFKHIHSDFLPSGLITTIDEAIRRAKDYGDFTQLARFMEVAPEDVTQNNEACELISFALKGDLPGRRGGNSVESLAVEVRNYHIINLMHFLKGYGVPVRSKSKKMGHEDACDIASRYVNKCGFSPIVARSIYRKIWLKHKKGYMTKYTQVFNLSYHRGRILKDRDMKQDV